MIAKLLTEHNLEFLSLKGGCTGSPESIHLKMPNCWKSHATALLCYYDVTYLYNKLLSVDVHYHPSYCYFLL